MRRDEKAADLEQVLVEMDATAVPVPPDARTEALARLSERRGKPVTASSETWRRVEDFLTDRFHRRTI